mmetsp:Transcript_4669/g.12710  ORF Transcript_4669/g.12710 Transcript_4669/m.12710 type:complete len:748 (+) Transcript_4669:141-2384(+)
MENGNGNGCEIAHFVEIACRDAAQAPTFEATRVSPRVSRVSEATMELDKCERSREGGAAEGQESRAVSKESDRMPALRFSDADPERSPLGNRRSRGNPMFVDRDKMKQEVRRRLVRKVYNVKDKYHTEGIWQAIARNPVFENTTLGVIGFNALWIWIDTDYNKAPMLLMAEPGFQIMEHLFAMYFVFELFTRFMAFKHKRDGSRDGWFCFDSALVFMMVAESWVMTIIVALSSGGGGGGGALGNASILRLFRLLRLTRMARMLRSMPELLILIKGMMAAMRSVFFVMLLLVILMYIFAIAFTQLTAESEVGQVYFSTIPHSMYTLTMAGTFLDNITQVVDDIRNEVPVCAALFIVFVLLAALTLMNMLIGVLCEVVQAVAAVEKEEMSVNFANTRMKAIIQDLDDDGNMMISKEEFQKILHNEGAVRALAEVGVDPIGLVDFADSIFESDTTGEDMELTFPEFMDIVLQFRGQNSATVKDFVDMRKFMVKTIRQELRRFHLGGAGTTMFSDSRAPSKRSTARSATWAPGPDEWRQAGAASPEPPSGHSPRLHPHHLLVPDAGGPRHPTFSGGGDSPGHARARAAKPEGGLKPHCVRLGAFLTAGVLEAQRMLTDLGGHPPSSTPGAPVPGQIDTEARAAMGAREALARWARIEEFVSCAVPELQAIQDQLLSQRGASPGGTPSGRGSLDDLWLCTADLVDFITKGQFKDFNPNNPKTCRGKVNDCITFLQARLAELQNVRGQNQLLL